MNCDKCGKPSVYRSTLIVNGVSQTTNLCRDCAIKEGVFTSQPTSIFDDMFSVFADFLPFEKVEDVVSVGDEIVVKVMEIDKQGKISLSRKDALADLKANK